MKKMIDKIKKSFTNNLSLKLIAIVIATVVWLIVINVNDPEKTITIYGVPVTIVDENAVTDMNMIYHVSSGNYISVTIKGKRSVLNNISAGDFIATASMKELSKVNAIPIEVTTKDPYLANKISIQKQSQQTMSISLEDLETDTFGIELEYKGSAQVGYQPGKATLSKDKVDIQAPISVLDKIDRVVAVCKLEGENEDFSKRCKINLYDRNGEKIKGDNIKLSFKKVDVEVDIMFTKELPIEIETIGNPDAGYEMTGIALSKDTVVLLANKEVLDNMDRLVVNSNISLIDETEDIVKTIDLTDYLPDGVSIQDESELEITIHITKLTQKVFKLEKDDLNINNIPDELNVDSVKSIEVVLRGDKNILDKISKKELNATVNLKNQESGKVQVPVIITIPDGTELVEEVVATIVLK